MPRVRYGAACIRSISAGIVEVTFEGHITGSVLEDLIARTATLLHGGRIRGVIIETSAVSGYDTDVRGPGGRWLRLLRERGAKTGVAITPSSAVRMIGSAISIGTGIDLRFFESHGAAAAAIAELCAPPAGSG